MVAEPKRSPGESGLTREGGLERYLEYAAGEPQCAAILVLRDADEDCAQQVAFAFAARARDGAGWRGVPIAIVVPRCEYEAWFLANLEGDGASIREYLSLPDDARPAKPAEEWGDAKGWLTEHMPPGRPYKPTSHQAHLTQDLDLDLTAQHSRSFQRLLHAVEELLDALRDGRADVTPNPPCNAVQDPD
jgi:hypothetical protein